MVKGSTNLSFKYNDKGIRTQKTVNGVTTQYYLNGDKVTLEEKSTDKIYYTYDSTGNLVSMNLNGAEYFYIRNAQGDIIGLWDKSGNEVVRYQYDSWGKLISTTGTLASSVGVKNPYLYRGYRYDSETGLYYLQSRYYNPEWGRFINADGMAGKPGNLLSHNMFAYALNNPINMSDPSGFLPTWAKWAIGVVAVVVVVAVAIVALPAEVVAAAGTAIVAGATAVGAEISSTTQATTNVVQRAGPAIARASQAASRALRPAATKGEVAVPNAERLTMSRTVQNHAFDIVKKGVNEGQLARPYINSNGTTSLVREIMNAGTPAKDAFLQNGLRWDVPGVFRGSEGTWELVVDLNKNMIMHFNFVTK